MVRVVGKPFFGTKEEYDKLDSDGEYNCPVCGLNMTTPYPGCHCPSSVTPGGYVYIRHVNKYHHNCDDAWRRAYGGG
jgi:hypothetical protein